MIYFTKREEGKKSQVLRWIKILSYNEQIEHNNLPINKIEWWTEHFEQDTRDLFGALNKEEKDILEKIVANCWRQILSSKDDITNLLHCLK